MDLMYNREIQIILSNFIQLFNNHIIQILKILIIQAHRLIFKYLKLRWIFRKASFRMTDNQFNPDK